MKKFKLLVLLCASTLLYTSCNENQETGGPKPVAVGAPDIIIPVQQAEDMYHRYGSGRASLIESTINVDDQGNPIASDDPSYVQATRSVTVDYKKLKQYIAFIEQESKKANTDITGLRLYFSQYAATENDGRASIFMNPVMKYGSGGISDDVAFAIDYTDGKPTSVYVKDCYKLPGSKSNQANLTMPIQGNIQSLAANDFPFRPPPNGGDPDYQ